MRLRRKDERRRQVEAVERAARFSPHGRGILLPQLRSARISMGLTQRDLAGMVKTSQSGIQELETLARGAYPRTISKLCGALEVEPQDLMCEEPTRTVIGDNGE